MKWLSVSAVANGTWPRETTQHSVQNKTFWQASEWRTIIDICRYAQAGMNGFTRYWILDTCTVPRNSKNRVCLIYIKLHKSTIYEYFDPNYPTRSLSHQLSLTHKHIPYAMAQIKPCRHLRVIYRSGKWVGGWVVWVGLKGGRKCATFEMQVGEKRNGSSEKGNCTRKFAGN